MEWLGGIFIVASTIAIFFVTYKDPELRWFESAGLAGSWASIVGIAITLVQVGSVNASSKISDKFTEDCNRYCKTMISDIKSLNANLKFKSNIDLTLIVDHLFDLSHFLNKLINELKNTAYAGSTISETD